MFKEALSKILKVKKYHLLIFCTFIIFIDSHRTFFAVTQSISIETGIELKLPSLIGIDNQLILFIIEKLSKELSLDDIKKSSSDFPRRGFTNKLLLFGPPGNGKSSLAREIAKASNCELLLLGGASIVGRYTGQGSENIRNIFEQAIRKAEQSERPVVIVIDEIDAIGAYTEGEYAKEHKSALQELWIRLDEYRHDPRVFIICTTNVKDTLNQAFISRFEDNIVEIKNPNPVMRERILRHYAGTFNVQLSDSIIKQLVSKSNNVSIRILEGFINSALRAQEIKKQVLSDSELLSILKRMKETIDNNVANKKDDTNKTSYLQTINQFCSIVHSGLSVAKMIIDIKDGNFTSGPKSNS